eukprot:snap_masked-scaffold123_size333416-processed-gene-0.1 protein:Tk05317 transcript:snap_masked-scaffold123_size333416-processed-gene-0.1-mRNA-1 annotation:"hypothetical protein"
MVDLKPTFSIFGSPPPLSILEAFIFADESLRSSLMALDIVLRLTDRLAACTAMDTAGLALMDLSRPTKKVGVRFLALWGRTDAGPDGIKEKNLDCRSAPTKARHLMSIRIFRIMMSFSDSISECRYQLLGRGLSTHHANRVFKTRKKAVLITTLRTVVARSRKALMTSTVETVSKERALVLSRSRGE